MCPMILASCLKTVPEGQKTYVSYYMTDVYFKPIPYALPECGLADGSMDATLKKLNGRWVADKPYIQRDYIVKFKNESDTTMQLTFNFPLLRRGESASYYYSANYVWTAKGPNSVKITGKMRESGYTMPISIGDPYGYDTLSVLHSGNYFRVQGCKVKMVYNVNGLEVKGTMNFDLGWEDFQ